MGSLVHVQVYIKGEEPCVALGRVVRIVAGAEASAGGFEVGLNFVRFISGYELVASAVNPCADFSEAEDATESVSTEAPAPAAEETPAPETEAA